MQRLQRLAALMLVVVIMLTNAGWAAAETSHQLDHGTAATEAPVPSEHGKAPGHGCSSHLGAHLFAPVESTSAATCLTHMDRTQPMVLVLHAIATPGGLFRPPRLLLQA